MSGIGDRVRELRELRGESVRGAADRIGVSHTTLLRIERGDPVDDRTLQMMAEAMDTTVDYLKGSANLRSMLAERLRLQPAGYRALLLSDPAHRLRFLLQFLRSTRRADLSLQNLATVCGLTEEEIERAEQAPPRTPREHVRRIAKAIEHVSCGLVGVDWVMAGVLHSDDLTSARDRAAKEIMNALETPLN